MTFSSLRYSHTPYETVRVLTHVDYRENLDWIESLSRERYRQDVLLLAGDVTDDLRLLGSTLRALKSRLPKSCSCLATMSSGSMVASLPARLRNLMP